MTRTSWNCARNRRHAGGGFSAASSLRPYRSSRVRASWSVRPRRSSVPSAATTSSICWRYAILRSGVSLSMVAIDVFFLKRIAVAAMLQQLSNTVRQPHGCEHGCPPQKPFWKRVKAVLDQPGRWALVSVVLGFALIGFLQVTRGVLRRARPHGADPG